MSLLDVAGVPPLDVAGVPPSVVIVAVADVPPMCIYCGRGWCATKCCYLWLWPVCHRRVVLVYAAGEPPG